MAFEMHVSMVYQWFGAIDNTVHPSRYAVLAVLC